MKIFRVPRKLLAVFLLLFLLVPISMVQVLVVAQAPWWQMALRPIVTWGAFTLAVLGYHLLMLRLGRRWPKRSLNVIGFIWCFLTAWVALRWHSTLIGVFFVLLSLYWYFVMSWLQVEMSRSFFDSKSLWYQGWPVPIPSVTAQLKLGTALYPQEWGVVRFDREGIFLCHEGALKDWAALAKKLRKSKTVSVIVTAEKISPTRGQPVEIIGKPICFLSEGVGIGISFEPTGLEKTKRLGEFVELLKGIGYA